MAIKKEDLLKFSKSVELAITAIEDDSSNDTEVKVLILSGDVTATGSIPTPDGRDMKVKGNKVYVAQENIEEMLKDTEEKDGVLVYKGPMHLDVSKPGTRTDANGNLVVTKAAKIWLTKTKFSRASAGLRTQQVNNLNGFINKLFSNGTLDLASEANAVTPRTQEAPKVEEKATGKQEPEVVVGKAASKTP